MDDAATQEPLKRLGDVKVGDTCYGVRDLGGLDILKVIEIEREHDEKFNYDTIYLIFGHSENYGTCYGKGYAEQQSITYGLDNGIVFPTRVYFDKRAAIYELERRQRVIEKTIIDIKNYKEE